MGKVGQWLQVGANIGILAGLVLVGLQMEQNIQLTKAALSASHSDNWITIDTGLQGENFAQTLAKSINQPEQLTDAEMLEVQGYLMASLDQWNRWLILHKMGLSESNPNTWIGPQIFAAFGNRFAQAWWAENRQHWNQLRPIIDEAIASDPAMQDNDKSTLDRIRARLNQPTAEQPAPPPN